MFWKGRYLTVGIHILTLTEPSLPSPPTPTPTHPPPPHTHTQHTQYTRQMAIHLHPTSVSAFLGQPFPRGVAFIGCLSFVSPFPLPSHLHSLCPSPPLPRSFYNSPLFSYFPVSPLTPPPSLPPYFFAPVLSVPAWFDICSVIALLLSALFGRAEFSQMIAAVRGASHLTEIRTWPTSASQG